MAQSSVEGPSPATAAELQEVIHAEREGLPFFVHRDGKGNQRILRFPPNNELAVGRSPAADLSISWDPSVSALHAELEQRAGEVAVSDDGLSRNGTFVNGERLSGQRTLRDGDVIAVGDTLLGFRDPEPEQVLATVSVPTAPAPVVSDAQRRVLVALCRPLAGDQPAAPATNEQIASELVLSLSAVKGHLRILFSRFGLDQAPQNQKRLLLAERALATSTVRAADLA
jgi:pSer/pThr/pTyr-binding forkhead associated (FHA) protein